MSEPIQDYGNDAAGNRVLRGTFVIDRAGNLIVIPPRQPIKASMRIATSSDIARNADPNWRELTPEPIATEPELFAEIESIDWTDPRD